MEKVSVIVPTYNCASFIGEALESIFLQTYQPHEIIVIDDGSTDNTSDIVRSMSIKDRKLKYIYQKNAGVSRARNAGLEISSGDFISFLDADDIWRPSMIEEQLSILTSDETIVCTIANFIRFDNATGCVLADQFTYYSELDQSFLEPGPTQNSLSTTSDAFCALVAFGEIPAFTQVMMFRKSHISNLWFRADLKICEDTEYALRAFMRGRVAFNKSILAEIRRHKNNATKDYSLIAIDKLRALLCIERDVCGRDRLSAYNDRLVKAHIDAAIVSRKNGLNGWLRLLIGALKIRGSYGRKFKGCINIVLPKVGDFFRNRVL